MPRRLRAERDRPQHAHRLVREGRGRRRVGWPDRVPAHSGRRRVRPGWSRDSAPAALLGERVLVDPWLRDTAHPDDLSRCGYLGSERDGGYAEYVTVPARNVHPVRSTLSDVELASFRSRREPPRTSSAAPVSGRARRCSSRAHPAGSGRRSCSSSAARRVAARRVRRDQGRSRARARRRSSPPARRRSRRAPPALGHETVDVVADVVSVERWPELIGLLRRGGRYTVAGAVAGPIVELDLRTLYLADLTFSGVAVTPPGVRRPRGRHRARRDRAARGCHVPARGCSRGAASFANTRHVGKIVLDLQLPP